jgi:catechol 2,3-dioxygenase-like lactoylglutathione lyase family enzyme
MPRVTGLGHVGIYVRDLERMVGFYRDFLGLQITKQNWRAGVVFLSADPEAADHEIAFVRGRPPEPGPQLIQQISFRVAALNDVREFHRRLVAEGYRIQRVVNHASAIGCYFYDPEDNCAEVFWLTGRESWIPVSVPIDLERSDHEILLDVERLWQKVRHIGVGERMSHEPATLRLDEA